MRAAAMLVCTVACTTLLSPLLARALHQTPSLNAVVVVDVTGSRHRCPDGVAGLPSSTLAGSGRTASALNDRGLIPPAVEPFVFQGTRPADRIRVGALAVGVRLSDPMQGNSPALHQAWNSVFALPPAEWLGPSPIWDVLVDLIGILSSEPGPRAIVLVSDGLATGNARTASDVERAALAAAVRIGIVFEDTLVTLVPLTTMADAIGRDPGEPLARIAEATGGGFFRFQGIVTPGQACVSRDPSPLVRVALDQIRR